MTLDRDQLSEAETLARAALSVIDVIEQTDFIMWRGDARMSLAYVLRNAGRPEEALTTVAEVAGELTFGSTKSHAVRTVPLPWSLTETLEGGPRTHRRRSRRAPVHVSAGKATPLLVVPPHRVGPNAREARAPKTEMHVLRHSAAARMSRAGWPAKAVQQGLGHATASFTLTVYGHLFEDDLDELAAAFEATSRGTSRVRAITR
jgi:integrase